MPSLLDLLERPEPQPIGRDRPLDERFADWLAQNDELVAFVTRRALAAARNGAKRLSTKFLLETARASGVAATVQGPRQFSIDNTFSGLLARHLMERHPELDGLFELRRRKAS